ncbi:hypothetical protein D9M68_240600 [compost metagenome]
MRQDADVVRFFGSGENEQGAYRDYSEARQGQFNSAWTLLTSVARSGQMPPDDRLASESALPAQPAMPSPATATWGLLSALPPEPVAQPVPELAEPRHVAVAAPSATSPAGNGFGRLFRKAGAAEPDEAVAEGSLKSLLRGVSRCR